MGPSPTYHPPKGEECETLVEHGLPLWAESAVGYCSRRPRPSPVWGSRFVGARAVGPWVREQKPLGKTPLRGNPSPEMTYLPTCPWGVSAGSRAGGGGVSREAGLLAMGQCGPLGGGREGRDRRGGAGLACGGSALVFMRGNTYVWCGVCFVRWSLPSTAALARILQMRVRRWCTSRSVVGRGYLRGGVRPTRQRILQMAW